MRIPIPPRARGAALAVAIAAAVAGALAWRLRTSPAPGAGDAPAGYSPNRGVLLPVGTADTTALDIHNAVQPQIDSLYTQIWKLLHPLDGTTPGVTPTPPGPPLPQGAS